MKLKSNQPKATAEHVVKDIREPLGGITQPMQDTHCSERLAGRGQHC